MKKRNYWPLFFIAIFSFAFSMIIWTIKSASKVPVHDDKSFLSSYHDIDRDYNKIAKSNINFEKKYDFTLTINGKVFPLTYADMFLAQRAIELKSKHKDLFIFGKNSIKITISDKNSEKVLKNLNIKLMVTVPTNDSHTINLNSQDFKFTQDGYEATFELPYKGNWNITGSVEINSDSGYFYIKSNAI
ncbi:hypothetical protein ACMC56_02280 [Campylobacterota bacterium DY0563]